MSKMFIQRIYDPPYHPPFWRLVFEIHSTVYLSINKSIEYDLRERRYQRKRKN